MSSGEVLCQTVELPPLSSEVASMLIVFKMDKNRKSDLEKMKDTRKELANLYDEYQHKANESTGGRDVKETGTKRIMRSSPSTLDLASKSVQPQVHFIQTKYTRVCRKLNMTRRQVCGECSIEVSVLMLMFDNLMKEDFGAKLNMSKYKTHLAEQLKSKISNAEIGVLSDTQSIPELAKRMASAKVYVSGHTQSKLFAIFLPAGAKFVELVSDTHNCATFGKHLADAIGVTHISASFSECECRSPDFRLKQVSSHINPKEFAELTNLLQRAI